MATATKPTILIVHGAWHIPQSYAKLTAALETSGFEVEIPRLTSVTDVRPPEGDLVTDTEIVRGFTENLLKDGRTVVALLHSYGGQVGSNALHGLGVKERAAQGLPGGVSHLIYMTAYAVEEGVAMMDIVAKFNNTDLVPLAFDISEEDSSCLIRDPKALIVSPGPEDNAEEVDEYLSTFERWNGKCMYQPIQHAAWREIPASYIITAYDMAIPVPYQKSFVELMETEGCKVQTFELATGHCPNFTATDDVVAVVKQVALA